jgi:hypothetical protein
MSNEFPRVLYREGGVHEVWGRNVSLRDVHDEDQLQDALKGGWSLRPDGHNEEPAHQSEFAILDAKIPDIKAALPKLTDDEILALYEAESRGKTRAGVIAALEAAMEARKPAPVIDNQPPTT